LSHQSRDARERPEPFTLRSWFAERAEAHATLLAFTLSLTLAITVVPPQARYRLFLVPAFIVYTSLALVAFARLLASRRWAPATRRCSGRSTGRTGRPGLGPRPRAGSPRRWTRIRRRSTSPARRDGSRRAKRRAASWGRGARSGSRG